MKFRFLLTLMLVIGVLFPTLVSAAGDPWEPEDADVELVVELKRDQDPDAYSRQFLAALDIPTDQANKRITHKYYTAIVGFSVLLTVDEYAKAERLVFDDKDSEIETIAVSKEVTLPVEVDPNSAMGGFKLGPDTQIVPTGVQRISAAPVAGQDFSNVQVAIIDTGIDSMHPDLNVSTKLGIDCTEPFGVGSPGTDGYGHGTHVSGIIAAKDNGMGVVGVAPGAELISVRVLNEYGSGTTASVICGIDYVAQHTDEIDVANMSLGGGGEKTECGGDDPMHNAICVATEETPFIVAAGNSVDDAANHSPANYDEVVTVSALADYDGQPGGAAIMPSDGCAALSVDDELAAYSNFGKDVDIAAPGTCILSTLPGERMSDVTGYPGSETQDPSGDYVPLYGYASGTSMAAPHVTGVIARFLSENPDQSEFAVEQVLTWSAAKGETFRGDHDPIQEPIVYVGKGAPRHER